jgi:hypothetical protein
MAQFYEQLNDKLTAFIKRQPIYFVATAATEGRINLSPKGNDTLRVLNDKTVAYLDLTGSGSETSAHILAHGRLTMMLCSFDGDPLILRLYGRGEIVRPGEAKWADLVANFTELPGQRQIVVLHIESVQTSCGFAVPKMAIVEERKVLQDWAQKKGPEGLAGYRAKKNSKSIDGLPTGFPAEVR